MQTNSLRIRIKVRISRKANYNATQTSQTKTGVQAHGTRREKPTVGRQRSTFTSSSDSAKSMVQTASFYL